MARFISDALEHKVVKKAASDDRLLFDSFFEENFFTHFAEKMRMHFYHKKSIDIEQSCLQFTQKIIQVFHDFFITGPTNILFNLVDSENAISRNILEYTLEGLLFTISQLIVPHDADLDRVNDRIRLFLSQFLNFFIRDVSCQVEEGLNLKVSNQFNVSKLIACAIENSELSLSHFKKMLNHSFSLHWAHVKFMSDKIFGMDFNSAILQNFGPLESEYELNLTIKYLKLDKREISYQSEEYRNKMCYMVALLQKLKTLKNETKNTKKEVAYLRQTVNRMKTILNCSDSWHEIRNKCLFTLEGLNGRLDEKRTGNVAIKHRLRKLISDHFLPLTDREKKIIKVITALSSEAKSQEKNIHS